MPFEVVYQLVNYYANFYCRLSSLKYYDMNDIDCKY